MTMLRAILVDDEPLALARLRRMLEPYRESIVVVDAVADGPEAVTRINELQPDVVFLDVQMPELSGFDVLEQVEYIPLVVFTTAFDRYALKAFDVYSVDYLLKPIDPGRLKTAVDKLGRLASAAGGEDRRGRMRDVGEALRDPHRRRIQVRTGDRIKLVPLGDVVCFHASDKYVEIRTRDGGSHLITRTLASLEAELDPDEFARVHRSVIVKIDLIDEITKSFDGGYEVRLKDKKRTRLPVSRRYRSRLDLS